MRIDDGGHSSRAKDVERLLTGTCAKARRSRDRVVQTIDSHVGNPSLPAARDRPESRNHLPFDLE
jgi:hypothetical protein